MLDAAFYDLTQTLWSAFFVAMMAVRRSKGEEQEPSPPLLQVQAGMAESPGWFLVQATEFDPEPLTVNDLRVRDVYASERIVQGLLEVMAAEKWFDRRGEAYYLTEDGRAVIESRTRHRSEWMALLDQELAVDIARLESLLHRVIQECLQCEDPPGSWCLVHSRNRAPAADAAVSVKLFHYVADINAFRDDAHMAAWEPLEIEGYVWEAFSLVAQGQALTAAALFDQLSHRGYASADYAQALHLLAQRGWVRLVGDGRYRATQAGLETREQVEQNTDAYFYASWRAALGRAEIAEVRDLMVRVRAELQELS